MAFLAAIPAAIGSFVGSAGLGSILQLGGALVSGIGALGAANYQAQVAENNAMIAEENAAKASQQAQLQQIQSDREIAALMGQQEAVQSASGLNTTGRSQVLTRRRTARIGRQDAVNIIEAGRTETRNFQQQAASFRGEAQMARRAGLFNAIGAGIGGMTSLVGGASGSRSTTAQRFRNNRIPLPNGTWTTWRP